MPCKLWFILFGEHRNLSQLIGDIDALGSCIGALPAIIASLSLHAGVARHKLVILVSDRDQLQTEIRVVDGEIVLDRYSEGASAHIALRAGNLVLCRSPASENLFSSRPGSLP